MTGRRACPGSAGSRTVVPMLHVNTWGIPHPARPDTPIGHTREEKLMVTRTRVRQPEILVMCPACRTQRRARAVGTATVDSKRREVVQCTDKACELAWVPQRTHLVAAAPKAA